MPTEVNNDSPSALIAMPSSSVVPEVTCCNGPSGNICRQIWKCPPGLALKYIHLPSGDQAPALQIACGPHDSACFRALEGNDLTGKQLAAFVHQHHHYPLAIRRKIGVVDHTACPGRNVNIAALSPALVRGDQDHVQALTNLGEEQAFATVDPRKGRCIPQKNSRLPAQNRDHPKIERNSGAVSDA